MKEGLFIPETKSTLDNVKAGYLSSHIQYRNCIHEIEQNIDFEYRSVRESFEACVDVALPYLKTTDNTSGEKIVIMTSLEKENNSKTFFIPGTMSYLKAQEGAISYKPVFSENESKENPTQYPNIHYGRVFPQIMSHLSLKPIHYFLNEVHLQYDQKPNVPKYVLDSTRLVDRSMARYQKKVNEQKSIYGKPMNAKLKHFMDSIVDFDYGNYITMRRLQLNKEVDYIIKPAIDTNDPILHKHDGFRFGVVPRWSPAPYSDIFDLVLAAEDVIIQKTLHEEEQIEVFDYLKQKMRKYCIL